MIPQATPKALGAVRSPLALYTLAALRTLYPATRWFVEDVGATAPLALLVEFEGPNGAKGAGEIMLWITTAGVGRAVWTLGNRAGACGFPGNWGGVSRMFADGMFDVQRQQIEFFGRQRPQQET